MGNSSRKSGIELIKIFAVVLIVLCHAVPQNPFTLADGSTYTDGTATGNPQFILVSFMGGAGLVGDVIFIVCSSYFLLDSKKISVSKIATMILNVLIISLIFMSVILALGYKLSPMTIVKQVFPTIFQNNWFISYYIVFYLLHPLFNLIINKLDKLTLGIAAALLFFHCSILLYALGAPPSTNKFLCFVNIYFVVAYFKKYGQKFCNSKKINVILCVVSAVLYIALRLGLNYLGLKVEFFRDRMLGYVHIHSPVIIVFSLTLFNLANMSNMRSKFVNYLSSLSLLIYIIHHNNLFAELIQPKWYDFFLARCGDNYFILSILTLAAIYFAGSVTSIDSSTFSGCIRLKDITIPDSVTTIGYGAFGGCTSLTSITIPNSVTSIDELAFRGCTSLDGIDLPKSVTSIGFSAFMGCTSLISIYMPNITSIGGYAFSGCTSLAIVIITDGVTSIDSSTFSGCTSLTSITIPNSVTSFGNSVFSSCKSLTDIYYGGSKSDWNDISKDSYWNSSTGTYTIHCSDGDVAKQ